MVNMATVLAHAYKGLTIEWLYRYTVLHCQNHMVTNKRKLCQRNIKKVSMPSALLHSYAFFNLPVMFNIVLCVASFLK